MSSQPQLIRRQTAGCLYLHSSLAAAAEARAPLPDIAAKLREWAAMHPDQLLISAPVQHGAPAAGREGLSYSQALQQARQVLARVRAAGAVPGSRIASLLSAGLEACVLRLACVLGNFVHCTLPPQPFRALASLPPEPGSEAATLWQVVGAKLLILPEGHPLCGSHFVSPPDRAAPQSARAAADMASLRGATQGLACSLSTLPLAAGAIDAGTAAAEAIGEDFGAAPQDWSAIFFTSGSSGAAKGVVITRGMIASNQMAYGQIWPFLATAPPVLIDWMPWHHVFGGLDTLFKIIWFGGSLHLTAPPAPSAAAASAVTASTAAASNEMIALMRAVQPSLMIGVPLALKLLLDAAEAAPDQLRLACQRLRHIFFAGAAMEPALWQRLQGFRQQLAQAGLDLALLTGYGATEAGSTMCLTPGPIGRPGYLGWPLPGHQVKLAPHEDRSELRFKGPNLAPCYLDQTGPVPLPLDDEGYYCSGDAAVLEEDPDGRPMLRFDGRLAEDFKLSSGVKVRSGMLRSALAAHLGAAVTDLVLGGAGGEQLVAMLFVPPPASGETAPGETAAARLARLRQLLQHWNRSHPASSTAIAAFDLADFTPSLAAGEVSGKGQLVPARILHRHQDWFAALAQGRRGTKVAAQPSETPD